MNSNVSGYFYVFNLGGYVARFFVKYDLNGMTFTIPSGNFSVLFFKQVNVPDGATNLNFRVEYSNGLRFLPLLNRSFPTPARRCYLLSGYTFFPIINPIECPPNNLPNLCTSPYCNTFTNNNLCL